MRNRVARGFIALSTVLGLLIAMPASIATADTIHDGDRVCSMYANSVKEIPESIRDCTESFCSM